MTDRQPPLPVALFVQLKASLEAALAAEDLLCGLSPEAADDRLAKRLGQKEFQRFCRLMDRVRAGDASLDDVYPMFTTVADAHHLMSAQGNVVIVTNAAVIAAAGLLSNGYKRVAEVGCLAGGVTRFLARQSPDCTFVGFDRIPRLLANARKHCPPNVELVIWDYATHASEQTEPFDVVWGALPVDLSHAFQLDLSVSGDVRVATDLAAKRFLAPAQHWRRIAAEKAHLVVALRIPDPYTLVGVLQVAALSGWRWLLDTTFKVNVGPESFPVLTFAADDSHGLQQEDVDAAGRRWARFPVLEGK